MHIPFGAPVLGVPGGGLYVSVTVVREGASGIPRVPWTVRPRAARVDAVPVRTDDGAPPERWQHGQVKDPPIAKRMPSGVMHGVQMLLHADPPLIGEAEERAANRFCEDYLVGILGARIPSTALRSGSADAHDVAIARAVALTRHNEMAETLGRRITGWLVDFVVNDFSFVAMSDKYWPGEQGRKEMRGAMVTLLTLLSHLYAALDRRRKKRAG